MREIKFRGKPIEDYGEINWFYGSLMIDYDDKLAYIEKNGQGIIPVEYESVGQYTGLKDMNGKEIYEGDVLTDHGEEGPLYVEFSKERASFDFVDRFDQFGITRYAAFQISYEQFEVIGNIYKNPELLEETTCKN